MFSRKDLVYLIVPLVMEQILMGAIGIVDVVMVASVGEAAVSSVSLVDSINMLLTCLFSALATGGAVVCSQYIGKGDETNANLAGKHLLAIAVLLATLVMLLCIGFNKGILLALYGSAEPQVLKGAQLYFYTSAVSYPFLALFSGCSALFRSMGNSRVPMVTSLFMNIIHVILNYILIYGLSMGVLGTGISSLASRAVSSIILLILLNHRGQMIRLSNFFGTGFSGRMVKNILRIAVPTGLEDSIFHVGKLLVQGVVTGFGTSAIAANAVALTITEFVHMPGYAMGLSLLTVVGRCIGTADYEQAYSYIKKIMCASYIVTGLLCAVTLIFAGPIISVYRLTPETARLAVQIVCWHAVAAAITWPAAFNISDALRAANDVGFTMIVSTVSMWTFRVGLSYVFRAVLPLGVLCVWLAMFADWLARAIVYIWRLKSGKWKNRLYI